MRGCAKLGRRARAPIKAAIRHRAQFQTIAHSNPAKLAAHLVRPDSVHDAVHNHNAAWQFAGLTLQQHAVLAGFAEMQSKLQAIMNKDYSHISASIARLQPNPGSLGDCRRDLETGLSSVSVTRCYATATVAATLVPPQSVR